MKLYRNICVEELLALLINKEIEGIFNFENEDSSYKKDMGPVVCFFTEPMTISSVRYDFFIELEIADEKVTNKGIAKFMQLGGYNNDKLLSAEFEEVYLRRYSLADVVAIKKYMCEDEVENKEIASIEEAIKELEVTLENLEKTEDNSWAFIAKIEEGYHEIKDYRFPWVKLELLYPGVVGKMTEVKYPSVSLYLS